jgi:glutamate--cysteine ligase
MPDSAPFAAPAPDSSADAAQLPEATEIIPHREAAEAFVTRICFKIGPPRLVGLELEWLLHDRRTPTEPLTTNRLAAALGPWSPPALHFSEASRDSQTSRHSNAPAPTMPNGSTVTVEPGGQLEISTAPAHSLGECLAAAAADTRLIHGRLARAGLTALGAGADPYRAPARILDVPRYVAMEAYFDQRGTSGRVMMGATAAVQPCLDAGRAAGPDSFVSRWQTLHAIGPALVAMFANSPVLAGRPTGWRSSRQAAWLDIDPARTAPPEPWGDPRDAYARYALDAPLLCVRRDDGPWSAPPGITFADWLAGAMHPAPTYDDLAYHLSTLFPPVRPSGHLEVRYLDAQPGDGWIAATAVTWALTATSHARDAADAAAEPVAGRWADAARRGLADPALARAARRLIEVALDGLAGQPAHIASRVADFADRYPLRGRCPADDWEVAQ